MPYKVLNIDWDKIIVDEINPQIHRHLSGRDFTEDDRCVQVVNVKNWAWVEKTLEVEVWGNEWLEIKAIYDREQAIEAYKEKYGRRPSSKMKIENIIAKL